jgi:gliding motility-associated-like protein
MVQSPPAQRYPLVSRISSYTAQLIATNNSQCSDTAYRSIRLLVSCYIAVPSAFTPNGDGLNDYLYPLNAFKAGNMIFRVFNRYGQIIFESRDPGKKWDGTLNGMQQPSGTYVWTLEFTHKDTGQKLFMNGTAVLIR